MRIIKSIACLGPAYSQSYVASRNYFSGKDLTINPVPTIDAVFHLVSMEEGVDVGLVPFQNLLEGDVGRTLDALRKYPNIKIVAEHIEPIHHCLVGPIGLNKGELDKFDRVYSHPQAHAQTAEYFRQLDASGQLRAECVDTSSTSEAARLIAGGEVKNALAISTKEAALFYGLTILGENIEDDPDNVTMFLEIQKEDGDLPICERSYFLFEPEDKPDQLSVISKVFGVNSVNLSFIQSRPTKRRLGESVIFLRADISREGECFSAIKSYFDMLCGNSLSYRILSS